MAIDYEFQRKNEEVREKVSRALLHYFEKNPDRAERHSDFVECIGAYLDRNRGSRDTEELNLRTSK